MKQRKQLLIAALLVPLILSTFVLPAIATPVEVIEIPGLPEETQDHVVDTAGALSPAVQN